MTTEAALSDPATICSVDGSLGEFGVYDLKVSEAGDCVLSEALAPVSANLALLVSFLVLAGAWILWAALNRSRGDILSNTKES